MDVTELNLIRGTQGKDELIGTAAADLMEGLAGNDTINGGLGDDILVGGAGDDILTGGAGSDTYRFSAGFGNDSIYNDGESYLDVDAIEFDGSFTPDMIRVSRTWSGDLVLMAGVNQTITVNGHFDVWSGAWRSRIHEVRFVDGTVWDQAALQLLTQRPDETDQYMRGGSGADYLSGGGGNDYLDGAEGDDVLDGGDGDDELVGGEGDNVLIGGAGNDRLQGGYGSDTYRFGAGFGQDTISDRFHQAYPGSMNVVEFDASIQSSNIVVYRSGNELMIADASGSNNVISVVSHFSGDRGINAIRFSDGTYWDRTRLEELAVIPSQFGQYLYGTSGDDVIDGLGGDDTIWGEEGNDHLFGGDGNDTVDGGLGNDIVDGGAGDDQLYGGEGDDTLYGGDGNDTLSAGSGTDVLVGGRGNDRIDWGEGSSTIVYERGDGSDYAYSWYSSSSLSLQFGAGIDAAQVLFLREGDNLSVQIGGTVFDRETEGGDGVYLSSFFSPSVNFAGVHFADGSEITALQLQQVTLSAMYGSSLGDHLVGTSGADYLVGFAGADTLEGGDGNDVLEGGAGNDLLIGGLGNDRYLFNKGWSKDVIQGSLSAGGADFDSLVFGEGIQRSDIAISSDGFDLLISRSGTSDSVRVQGFFHDPGAGTDRLIDEMRFIDGTSYSVDDIYLAQQKPTSAEQTIHGRGISDVIDGGGGNDRIFGYGGDDILIGGSGHDHLVGGSGSDIYRFEMGWGQDSIDNNADDFDATDADTIEFGAGVAADDMRVYSSQGNLILQHADGNWVSIENFFAGPNPVQAVNFADGTHWGLEALIGMQMRGDGSDQYLHGSSSNDLMRGLAGNDVLLGHAGDDSLEGGDGDDVLDGGTGNDALDGGDGNDMFLFGRGSGHDQVLSSDPDGIYWDVVQMGQGVSAAEVSLSLAGRDLVLSLDQGADSLTLKDYLPEDINGWPTSIDEIWFADGTVWDAGSVLGALATTSSGLAAVGDIAQSQRMVASMASFAGGAASVAAHCAVAPSQHYVQLLA